jgi:hypothetical protein
VLLRDLPPEDGVRIEGSTRFLEGGEMISGNVQLGTDLDRILDADEVAGEENPA